jgi:hypothetical protein
VPLACPRLQAPLPGSVEPAQWLVDRIAERESDAERSLMHRYNIGRVRALRCRNLSPACRVHLRQISNEVPSQIQQ